MHRRGRGACILIAALCASVLAPNTPASATSGLAPYKGLGTWIDVYDWSRTYGTASPLIGPADVDRMAADGVQTLYVQAAKWDAPTDVVDRDLLVPIIDRAKAVGIKVVAWYLPALVDPDTDVRRIVAIAHLGVDGVAVDIEARNVSNPDLRNQRLVGLSRAVRGALPARAIGAIVLPPVVTEVINPRYWPRFPYRQIAPFYDVWLPMDYWTNRTQRSGWRDGYRYSTQNVVRLRRDLGRPGAAVHIIGGIADRTVPADVGGLRRAAREQHALGASLYDWHTTTAGLWPYLQPLRAPQT